MKDVVFKIGITMAVFGWAVAVLCGLSGFASPVFGFGIFFSGMFLALCNALAMMWRKP